MFFLYEKDKFLSNLHLSNSKLEFEFPLILPFHQKKQTLQMTKSLLVAEFS